MEFRKFENTEEEEFKKSEENKKLTLKQAKKKFKINNEKSDIIIGLIKENKNITCNKISQALGLTVANVANFLKSQGIKIKRY